MLVRRIVENLSLFLLIAVAIVRPLIGETYDSAGSSLTEALGELTDPTPLRTLVFDVVILAAACGWLLARAIGPPRRYRWTGLEWGAALVVVAACVSCLVAGNKRLAINASVDWVCYPVLTIALVQLMGGRWQRRLLLAGVLASASAQAVQCFDQYFVSFDDTWTHYQGIREQFWARQGVDLDSAKVELFERRMLAHEATGYLPHSNVTGSYLVLCGLAAAGLSLRKWRTSGSVHGRIVAGGCWVLAGLMIAAAALTGSLGASLAGAAGIALWMVLSAFPKWFAAHRGRALVLGWCVAVAGLLAVAGYGVGHGALPGPSLNFRWQYWRASAGLIADHAFAGVGRENFGRHYLAYKSIESPEEVANPHNLFVQAAADWGIMGLVGVVVMLVGASRAITRSVRTGNCELRIANCETPNDRARLRAILSEPGARATGAQPRAGAWGSDQRRGIAHGDSDGKKARTQEGKVASLAGIPWVLVLGAVVVFGRLPLLGSDDASFLYVAAVMTGLPWLIGFLCFLTDARPEVANGDRRAGYQSVVGTAVAVGLLAFVLHEMINFAAFVPGSATTCFALLAYCIAERRSVEDLAKTSASGEIGRCAVKRWTPLFACAAVLLLLTIAVVVPVARATHRLETAREAMHRWIPGTIGDQPADRYLRRAAEADPLDPTPHAMRADWLLAVSSAPVLGTSAERVEALELGVESLTEAIERDPFNVKLKRRLMQAYQATAKITGGAEDYDAAVRAAREALVLYPLDPSGLVSLGDCLLLSRRLQTARTSDRLRAAIDAYQRALQLDKSRPEWETIRRFRPQQRAQIEANIAAARRAMTVAPE